MSLKTISMGMTYLVYIYIYIYIFAANMPEFDLRKSIFLWTPLSCKKKTPFVYTIFLDKRKVLLKVSYPTSGVGL